MNAYTLTFTPTNCASGRQVAAEVFATYIVDNVPPTISSPFPTGWTTGSPSVGCTFWDDGWGVDASTSSITVDGLTQSGDLNQQTGIFQAAFSGLADGQHLATITLVDVAGNSTTTSHTFNVDTAAPTLSDPSPTGAVPAVGAASPLLKVAAGDDNSGVAPASISMVLSNGMVSSQLHATYERATGFVEYQVPTTVKGTALGQFPLVQGNYKVTTSVRDVAGNIRTISWSFSVQSLPA